jgi:hypothetical protein
MVKRDAPWLMLFSRSALFIGTQALIGLGFLLAGASDPLREAARWWPFFAVVANIVCALLLARLFKAEGGSFRELFRFRKEGLKTDLLWLLVTGLIGLPIAAAPMQFLAPALYGDSLTAARLLFQPLPTWALVASLAFPLTMWIGELPTYFGYAMPRLALRIKSPWGGWLIASLFLAIQHAFLPFLPDPRFWIYRALMYLPFALFAGLVLKLRPRMLPYFCVIHVLMDLSALSVYLMV